MKKATLLRLLDFLGIIAALAIISCAGPAKTSVPFVEILSSSAITVSSATLTASMDDDGGSTVTEAGFVYAPTSANPTLILTGSGVTKIVSSSSPTDGESFSAKVTGLTPGVSYSFAGYAVNSDGVGYTAPATFTAMRPATGSVDTTVSPSFTGLVVLDSAEQPDGKVLVGGIFSSISGSSRTGLARFNADGSLDSTFNPVLTGGSAAVFCLAVQADGLILIGGDFSAVNGTPESHLARLKADGSVDTAFNDGTGPNDSLSCLSLQRDGHILIGGDFTSVNGTPLNNLARLNPDGSVESTATFNPGTGFSVSSGSIFIASMAVQEDGKIVIGGTFDQFNGQARPNLVRLNADGSVESTTTFTPLSSATTLNSLAVQADGKILIAGSFTTVDGQARSNFARLNADGTLEGTTTFNLGTGADSPVETVALQTDGKILLGGNFTLINGATRDYLARLNSDGTLESTATFNPGFTSTDTRITTITGQADGEILLGGDPAGTSPQIFYRLNNDPAPQSLTTPDATQVVWTRGGAGPEVSLVTFELSTNSGTTWTLLGAGTRFGGGWQLTGLTLPANGLLRARGRLQDRNSSGLIEQVATLTAGRPVVSGQNSSAVGTTSAALGGNVTSDGGFAITERGVVFSVLTTNADPTLGGTGVTKLTQSGTTGSFTVQASNLTTGTTYAYKAFATNGRGTTYSAVDTFSAVGLPRVTLPVSSGISTTSATLGGTVASDSPVTACGVLYLRGTSTDAPRLTGRTTFTTLNATPGTGPFSVQATGLAQGATYSFVAFATNAAGTGYSTSVPSFTTLSSDPAAIPLAGTIPVPAGSSGALDSTYNPNVTGTPNAYLQATAVQPDGKTLIAGFFDTVGGAPHQNIARLMPDGSVDATFTAGTNFGIYSIAVQPDGKILLAGLFTQVNGVAQNFFARLNPDGSLEDNSTFDSGSGADAVVYSIATQPDGKILLGGLFSNVNGVARTGLARLLANGSVEDTSTFNAGSGANDAVFNLAVQPDGKILAGGAFTTVNGTTRNHLARLNADGSLESAATFNPGSGANDWIDSLAVQPDGRILVGGYFTAFNGTIRNHIARLNANGSVETTATFNPGSGADGNVLSMALQADGKIVLGGAFLNVNGSARQRLARLNADGTVEDTATFNSGTGADGEVDSVAVQADGQILVGGAFASVNGTARNLLARLSNDAATQTLGVKDAARAVWLRGGTAPEVSPPAFELSTDGGANWAALGTGTRIAGGWQLSGQNLPSTGSLRASGGTAGGFVNSSAGLVRQVATFDLSNPLNTNTPPVAPNLTVKATPGDQKTIVLPFAATDADGDPVTLTNATALTHIVVDSFAGHSVVFTPEGGFTGNATFTYTLNDGTGSANATATGTVTVIVNPAPVTLAPVPGSADTYFVLGTPQPGAFAGTALLGRVRAGAIFASNGSELLKVGVGGVTRLGAPSGDAVLVTLRPGGEVTRGNSVRLMTGLLAGTPVVAAETGTAAAGLPAGVTIRSFLALDGNGQTTFALVTLQGTGVTPSNNLALISIVGGNVRIVARRGESVTIGGASQQVSSLSVLATLVGSRGTLAASRWRVDDSDFGIRVTLANRQQAIFLVPTTAQTAADWTLLAQTGPITGIAPLNGITAAGFGLPGFGNSSVAQLVVLARGAGVTPADNVALTSGNSTNGFTQLARKGATAPDATGADMSGVLFNSLADPISGADGATAFAGTLRGIGVTRLNNSGLWYAATGTTAKLLARTGDQAPGGGHWRAFTSLVLPADSTRGPVFTGTLNVSVADGVSRTGTLGLWAVNSTGTLTLLFRSGQAASVNGTAKTVKAFTALAASAGSVGAASGYDNAGEVAVLVTFSDNTRALLVLPVP